MFGRQQEQPTVPTAEREAIKEGPLARLREEITVTDAAIKEAKGIVAALSGSDRAAFDRDLDGIRLDLDGIGDKCDDYERIL